MSDLCTLQELKDALPVSGSTDDTKLQALITRASRLIERHFARKFYAPAAGADANPITEYLDGMATPDVWISRTPADSVASVHDSTDQVWDATTLIAATDYIVDLERGIIRLKGGSVFFPGFRNVRVIYNQTTTVPDDAKLLAIEICSRAWKGKDMIHLRSLSAGDGSATERLVGHFVTEVARDFSHLYRPGRVVRS